MPELVTGQAYFVLVASETEWPSASASADGTETESRFAAIESRLAELEAAGPQGLPEGDLRLTGSIVLLDASAWS